MAGLRFLVALAALPLIGRPFLRSAPFDELSPAARWGLAGVAGALALCVEMVVATWVHARWSLWLLLLPPVLAALVPRRRPRRAAAASASGPASIVVGVALATVGVVAYAAATARATAGDYVLFWGTKGERFAMARAIDVAFLKDPLHVLMHPDYPPMLPCLYAWGALAAGVRGVVPEFLLAIGINSSQFRGTEVRCNETVGPFTVNVAREVLRSVAPAGKRLKWLQSERCKKKLAAYLEEKGWTDARYCGLRTSLARHIEKQMRSDNRCVRAIRLGQTVGRDFCR